LHAFGQTIGRRTGGKPQIGKHLRLTAPSPHPLDLIGLELDRRQAAEQLDHGGDDAPAPDALDLAEEAAGWRSASFSLGEVRDDREADIGTAEIGGGGHRSVSGARPA
jgi:hypothetical protein